MDIGADQHADNCDWPGLHDPLHKWIIDKPAHHESGEEVTKIAIGVSFLAIIMITTGHVPIQGLFKC